MSAKQTELWEIFALRRFLLRRVNPKFFGRPDVAALVMRMSLATQDWVVSGDLFKAQSLIQDQMPLGRLPGYLKLNKKYDLDCGLYPFGGTNPAQLYELGKAYLHDWGYDIISKRGKLQDVTRPYLLDSSVLKVAHNCPTNGLPCDGIRQFKDVETLMVKFRESIKER